MSRFSVLVVLGVIATSAFADGPDTKSSTKPISITLTATVPAKVTDGPTDNDPNAPLKPGLYWYAYTIELPGMEPAALSAKRKQHLLVGGAALGDLSRSSGQPRLAGSKVNGNSNNPKERDKFALIYPIYNPRITPAQYARYYSAMVGEGGVLVMRLEIDENGVCWVLDEDPVLLSDSVSAVLGEKPGDDQKRVYKLLAAAPAHRVPGQMALRARAVVASNGTTPAPANHQK